MRRLTMAVIALSASVTALAGGGQKFYPDDPLWRDPESQDASSARPITVSERYDFVENTFLKAGDRAPKRAMNINTVDEVPDSSWFTNRIGRQRWTVEQLVRGPNTTEGPTPGLWRIVASKSEGVTSGLTVRDRTGEIYFIKFDPPSNPELASAAEIIATKFFYAFGYYTPENYIASIRREDLVIEEGTRIDDEDGRPRDMTEDDLDDLLDRAAQTDDGSYRVLASRALAGTPLGHFRYYGTRPDDPNDIFPHEHRRELRGLAVFAAWLNHDDSRSINTLDTLVEERGRSIIRHHLIDFGSTLGSGSTGPQTRRAGNEFVWEARPTLVTMLTLGFYVRPWVRVPYPDLPAVGRFESTYYRPEAWKPEYPNPAFRNARPEDRFWAARILSQIPDEGVRAVVASARYSDPRATEYVTETLLARRAKVLRTWLNGTNPIVNVSMSSAGVMTFENAAEEAGMAKAAEKYTVEWARLDNQTGALAPVGSPQTITARSVQSPAALLTGPFVAATIRGYHPDQPAWQDPVIVYFRRASDSSWQLVGLERNP